MPHTKAPWHARSSDESQTAIFPDRGKGPLICVVSVGDGRPDGHENSLLITAAPDLLAACKVMLDDDIMSDEIRAQAEAAIKKAEEG